MIVPGTSFINSKPKNSFNAPNTEKKTNLENNQNPPWENPTVFEPIQQFPPYFRPSVTIFPKSSETARVTGIPLGIVISPGDVNPRTIVDLTQIGTVRCHCCSAFLSPWSKIVNDNTWVCQLCGNENMNLSGGPPLKDRLETKEAIIDILAPSSFIDMPNARPCFLFMIDISKEAFANRFCQAVIASILTCIEKMDDSIYVSLITYSNTVTVYDFEKMRQRTYVELDEKLDNFESKAVPLKDCKNNLKIILNKIIENIPNAQSGNCYGNALLLAEKALKQTGGLILSFLSSYPTIGPYRILPRSKDELLHEEKMMKMNSKLCGDFYQQIAYRFAKQGTTLYSFSSSNFADLATTAVPCGLTGGHCFVYEDTTRDYLKLHNDIFETLMKDYLWDANMRMRMPLPVLVKNTHGNCCYRDRDLLSIPVLDPKDSITFEFSVESHITTPSLPLQFALVWTNKKLQRMIRIFNFSFKTSHNIELMYQNIDETALSALILKRAVRLTLKNGPESGLKSVLDDTRSTVLRTRLLTVSPHFTFGMFKNKIFKRSSQIKHDWRMCQLITCRGLNAIDSCLYSYPRLLTFDGKSQILSSDSLFNKYLILHMWDKIFVWATTYEDLLEYIIEPINENDHSIDVNNIKGGEESQLWKIIQECREISHCFLPVYVLFGGDNIAPYLAEDRVREVDQSYMSWVNQK